MGTRTRMDRTPREMIDAVKAVAAACGTELSDLDAAMEVIAIQQAGIKHATKLIERVVTGDGAQTENLEMSEDEWRQMLDNIKHNGDGDEENFPVTMRFDDWMGMIAHVKFMNEEIKTEGGDGN